MYGAVMWDGVSKVKSQKFSNHWTAFTTEMLYSVTDANGTYPLSLKWNRLFDTVYVHGKTYRRKEGQVFAIARNRNGEIAVKQFPSAIENIQAHDVLVMLKNAPEVSKLFNPLLPNNSFQPTKP